MRIDSKKPYKLIYSLSFDEKLGPLIHGFVIELNEQGKFTLANQRVTPTSLGNFPNEDNEKNRRLLKLIEEYSPTGITKRFSKKSMKPTDFLKKFTTEENIKNYLKPFLEIRLSQIIEELKGETIYERLREDPIDKEIKVEASAARVIFCFEKLKSGTRYHIEVRHKNQWIHLAACDTQIIVNDGAWIKVGNTIYHFREDLEGKKLLPFFSKDEVNIPQSSEKPYYQKFVKQTCEQFKTKLLNMNTGTTDCAPSFNATLINNSPAKVLVKADYAGNQIDIDSPKEQILLLEYDEKPRVQFVKRKPEAETEIKEWLEEIGTNYVKNARFQIPADVNPMDWINEKSDEFRKRNIQIELSGYEEDYYLGKPELNLSFSEESDWFDIKAVIRFGEFEIPFVKLRKNILNHDKHFKLPNGQIAVIPDSWFDEFRYLFAFGRKEKDQLVIDKRFANLLNDTKGIDFDFNTEAAPTLQLETRLEGTLRNYQKDGFKWLANLAARNYGGVLADDMGLGKTLQTIALLESLYLKDEEEVEEKQHLDLFSFATSEVQPSLIVVPSSLIHNWVSELNRFAPGLNVHIHAGQSRINDPILFKRHHIIITTYGLVRNDVNFLREIKFKYLILDESQTIKNPTSKIAQTVNDVEAENRLALTGTPIENSLSDLWSQMNFLNKGLLGSYNFFKSEFVGPIERDNDEKKKKQLKKLAHPFILRRTKEQVAKELPPLSEQTLLCDMQSDQEDLYERTKSKYRNYLLEQVSEEGLNKSRFMVLKGLLELRLIANHPKLYDKESTQSSGKYKEIKERLSQVYENGHSILVFSQFTRQLKLIEEYLIKKDIDYNVLTGATRNRKEVIDNFTKHDGNKVFLISLKAGGIGLNLTKADYVFILDPWWNPFAEKQAIDRAYRIGQEQHVFSYRFITRNTIEEKIVRLQDKKRSLADDFIPIGKQKGLDFSKEDLEELLS